MLSPYIIDDIIDKNQFFNSSSEVVPFNNVPFVISVVSEVFSFRLFIVSSKPLPPEVANNTIFLVV